MRIPSIGLVGRIVLILAFVLIVEFFANTLVLERANRFALRDDEAHRMAEHLVVARRVMDRTPVATRPAVARQLSTARLHVSWHPGIDTQATRYSLPDLRAQMLAFEPQLLDAKLRLYLQPLRAGGDISGSVELSDHSTMRFESAQPHAFWQLTFSRAIALLLPVLLLAIAGGLLINMTLRPLRMLMNATRTVGKHEPVPLPEQGPNEIRALIRDFNAMQQRIHRLVTTRTQALAAVGHDLRTPLARLELRLHGSSLDEDTRAAMTDDISEMSDLLRSLQIYLGGEGEAMPAEKVDVAVMAATVIDTARDEGKDAVYDGPANLVLMVRPVGIRRALANLVENALHYAGNVRLAIRQNESATLLQIDDDGPGISPDKIESVMQPFVRLDEGRARNTRGMGLGLSIVENAVRAEGGTFTLENRPEGGLRATISLPQISA